MTAQQDATNRIKKYENAIYETISETGNGVEAIELAKKCAKIEINAIVTEFIEYGEQINELQNMDGVFRYWDEVNKNVDLY